MTETPPVADQPTSGNPVLLPPDEKFWVRYSPHNEFHLSSASSLFLYALLGIGVWVGYQIYTKYFSHDQEPIPLETVSIPGLGGVPGGPAGGDGSDRPEDLGNKNPQQLAEMYKPSIPLAELPQTEVKIDPKLVDPKDAEVVRYFTKGNISAESLSKVGQEASALLMQQVGGNPGPKGPGTGTGGTGGDGGTGKIRNERQKRTLRWTMMFDTRTGDDYRQQLLAMGAILGIPGADGQYRIIRDLKQRPARMEEEDLKKINRIFWVDDRPDSVGPLAQALGIELPNHIVAFFPEKLEAELLRKELAFAHRKESDIQQTRFRVVRSGNNFQPIVVDQTATR